MNKLTASKRAEIIRCLVEGNSIRSTVRITGAAKNTVTKLLVDAGRACSNYQNRHLRNLPCKRIQVDEVWSFVHVKAKNVATAKAAPEGVGDIWTWTAICADTKLVPCWVVGARDSEYAFAFIDDLRQRLANRVQLTSDGHKPYLQVVEEAFGADIDYAMLVKLYGSDGDGPGALGSAEVQPRPLHRKARDRGHRQSRSGAREHQLRRAPEPHHAHEHASVHAADERVQ